MAIKKQQPEKQYIMLDPEGDLIALGNWEEIRHALLEFESDSDEDDEVPFDEWITQITIHELGVGKKIKYTPSRFELK
jgi:hypothetical protein